MLPNIAPNGTGGLKFHRELNSRGPELFIRFGIK